MKNVEANLDCPQCQGVGEIEKGLIIEGKITNVTREQCWCIAEQEYNEAQQRLANSYAINEYGMGSDD